MSWNEKKRMPIGSTRCARGKAMRATASTEPSRKSRYLKVASEARLTMMPATRKPVAAGCLLQARQQPGGPDLADEKRNEPRIPPPVEDERCRDQHPLARNRRAGHAVMRDEATGRNRRMNSWD